MPITAKQSVNQDWDFNVVQEPLSLPNGKKSGFFAATRSDTEEILGVHTDRYAIVQNTDLVERAEDAFERKGMTNYERKIYSTDGGAKLRVTYDFKDKSIEIPEVGDEMGFRLVLQNSFDRSLRVSFALGFLRLVCTNGMQTLEKELDMLKKHSKSLDIESLLTDNALDKALARFDSAGEVCGNLAKLGITQEQGIHALQNQATSGLISDKVREGIASVWNSPREDGADGEVGDNRTLYQLYHAATQYLTSDNLQDKDGGEIGTFESTRFEYANRISGQLLKRFDLAAKNPTRLKKLVALPKGVDVQVENN